MQTVEDLDARINGRCVVQVTWVHFVGSYDLGVPDTWVGVMGEHDALIEASLLGYGEGERLPGARRKADGKFYVLASYVIRTWPGAIANVVKRVADYAWRISICGECCECRERRRDNRATPRCPRRYPCEGMRRAGHVPRRSEADPASDRIGRR